MAGSNYEEYKRERAANEKKKEGLHSGKICLAVGFCMLIYSLCILPYRADNLHRMHGDEIKAAKEYSPEKAYRIDKLEVLEVKTDTDGAIYAIARFLDCDQKDWIVLLTPGRDGQMAEQLSLFERFQKTGNELTVSGCFLMKKLEDLPFAADSYYSVYGAKYANEDKSNLPSWNTEYLCAITDNHTVRALFQRGIPLVSFVAGVSGILYGAVSLIRCRKR